MTELTESEKIDRTTLRHFLERTPPGGQPTRIADLGGNAFSSAYSSNAGAYFRRPEILLHCDTPTSCGGLRLFVSENEIGIPKGQGAWCFVTYVCKNCSKSTKHYALWLQLDSDLKSGSAFKVGEYPQFGPPTPPRLTTLIREDKDLFFKGRRAENQGMGIAAFAYYRRVVDNQRERIFDEIIRVCKALSAGQPIIDELEAAKKETQFTKAIESVKHALPQALFINGQNPLMLLHSALSDGLHGRSDEECLELAAAVRVVMAEFADRMGQAMKDEAELTTAVTRLLKRKAPEPPE